MALSMDGTMEDCFTDCIENEKKSGYIDFLNFP